MNHLLRSLGVCALLTLGGAASAQNIGPRGPGEELGGAPRGERRQEFREERRGADRPERGDRPDGPGRRDRVERPERGDRPDGGDRPDRGGDFERRDRSGRADRGERFEERGGRGDRVGGRIVVRPGPGVRFGTVVREDFRPGFVVTGPLRSARVVCRVVRERRFNPRTGVLRVRPVRECSRFVGRRRVIVSRRILG
jgi:hypothetical protein